MPKVLKSTTRFQLNSGECVIIVKTWSMLLHLVFTIGVTLCTLLLKAFAFAILHHKNLNKFTATGDKVFIIHFTCMV